MAENRNPPITVLTGVYNGEAFLRQTINSILAQTFTDFEYLLVDDGSTDRSVDIIRSIPDPRIRLVENHANRGIAETLNRGLSLARGEYIAIIDQDDLAMPERLALQKQMLDNDPHLGLVSTSLGMIDTENRFICRVLFHSCIDSTYIKWLMMFSNPLAHTTCMYRKQTALDAGGYSSQDGYPADYGLFARIAQIASVKKINPILSYWRKHQNTSTKNAATLHLQALAILKRTVFELTGTIIPDNVAPYLFVNTRKTVTDLEVKKQSIDVCRQLYHHRSYAAKR